MFNHIYTFNHGKPNGKLPEGNCYQITMKMPLNHYTKKPMKSL